MASQRKPPRFARRSFRIEFWGQKRIGGFAKYGSSRCFSEMLSFRKDFLIGLNSRLDSRIKRTHEPVRAKTTRQVLNVKKRPFNRFLGKIKMKNFLLSARKYRRGMLTR